MLKVLHVINDLDIGGAEKLLKDLVPVLQAKGIGCEILMLDGKDTFIARELSEKHNIPLHSVGKDLNIYNPFILFKLRSSLRDYDIIHAHLFPSQYWIAIAKKIFSLKSVLVTTEHSSDNKRRRILILRLLEQIIYKQYKYVIAVSEKAAENIGKHLNNNSRIRVIENGINLKVISEAAPYSKEELLHGCNAEAKIILNVARFNKAKDHGTLIKSMLLLPEDLHLILIGEGELKAGFMQMVRKLKLESRIHFLGARQDVDRILKSVDIIVMSSIYEGLSLSAIEGMASGKPFIASDVDGLNEIVKDAGLLFETGNYKDLADKVILLLENKDYSEMIAKRCMKKASQYNIEKTADLYFEIYHSAMSGNDH